MTRIMKALFGIGTLTMLGPAMPSVSADIDWLGAAGGTDGAAGRAPRFALDLLQDEPADASSGRISDGTNFYFRLAGWYTGLDASLSYGEPVSIGPVELDFEKVLGYDSELLTLRGQFGWTFAERHHLDFGINGPLNYDGRLTRDASFDNLLFSADASSTLDMLGIDADYSYDVVSDDQFRFFLTGGIRAFLFSFELEGEVSDSNGNSLGQRSESLDAGAGLPVLGLGFRWDFTRKLYIAAKGVGFYGGDYGNAYDASVEFGWDFTKRFGVFVGFRYIHAEVDDLEIDDGEFNFNYDLFGPYAGVEVRF